MTASTQSVQRQLSPAQQEVLDHGLLQTGFDCILQMPTGSGKTWLAEEAIEGVLRQGRRAVYLTPLRALAQELAGRWGTRFAPHPVGTFTGDFGTPGRPFPVPFAQAHLLVMTPERLDACTRCWQSHWGWLPEVDLVVVDEFHLLGDGLRGARLEGALSRARRLNPFLRLLCLSATLGNREELSDWLGAVEYASDWRPIPLDWKVVRYKRATDKPELLRQVVAENVGTGGKSLVFVQSRRRAEEICRQLQSWQFRAAHHHAGLLHENRANVEGAFRRGETDVLVATATLEMGLNLPVRQVVLYDLQAFDGNEFRPLSCRSVWQRGGRAGRPGLDTRGEAVLLAAAWDRQAETYVKGRFEPIRSGLACPRALAEQALVEVSAGLARSPLQLGRIFGASLAARQKRLPDVDRVVREMLAAGMLAWAQTEDEEARCTKLKATRLGRIAVRHFLAPSTVLLFRRFFDLGEVATFLDLLLVAASCPDCEPLLPVDYEELEALGAKFQGERSRLLAGRQREVVATLGIGGKRLLSALKTSLAVREWTRLGDADRVADSLSCYPFEVHRLVETMDRLLTGMRGVLDSPEPADQPAPIEEEVTVGERLRALHRMVVAGLDEEAITLTLVAGIGPKLARRLKGIGIEDVECLAQASAEDLAGVRGISRDRASRWIDEAVRLLPKRSGYGYREGGPTASVRCGGFPSEIDPYRLRRALDLKVSGGDGDTYCVTGGLGPHRVQSRQGHLHCDCADFDAGMVCKHLLAVRLRRGDETLSRLARQLRSGGAETGLDLFDLWYDQAAIGRGDVS
jgi:helicase